MKTSHESKPLRALGIAGVIAVVTAAIFLLAACRTSLSVEKAKEYADEELRTVISHLEIDENSLVGPINARKSKNDFYFTWALRTRPDRPAIIVWVSNTGETDSTIIDDEIVGNYQKQHELKTRDK